MRDISQLCLICTMKTVLRKVVAFFKREWFLILAVSIIALIIVLFEVL